MSSMLVSKPTGRPFFDHAVLILHKTSNTKNLRLFSEPRYSNFNIIIFYNFKLKQKKNVRTVKF